MHIHTHVAELHVSDSSAVQNFGFLFLAVNLESCLTSCPCLRARSFFACTQFLLFTPSRSTFLPLCFLRLYVYVYMCVLCVRTSTACTCAYVCLKCLGYMCTASDAPSAYRKRNVSTRA